jgi:hypothetical protein
LNSNQIFLFGGINEKREVVDLSLIFDFGINRNIYCSEKKQITPFETKGHKPGARAFHVLIENFNFLENDSLFVYLEGLIAVMNF